MKHILNEMETDAIQSLLEKFIGSNLRMERVDRDGKKEVICGRLISFRIHYEYRGNNRGIAVKFEGLEPEIGAMPSNAKNPNATVTSIEELHSILRTTY